MNIQSIETILTDLDEARRQRNASNRKIEELTDALDNAGMIIERVTAERDELKAQLAKYQKLKPVAYSVTCDGIYTGNVFGQKQTAEHKMQILDESWPENSRKVVPLYALEK